MPKDAKDLADSVMDQIRNGRIKMRPKIYFIFGSIFMLAGFAASVVCSVFFISLISFLIRAHGPMGKYRLEELLGSFPWWAFVSATVSVIIGVFFLRRYDFSYKKNFTLIIIGFILSIIIGGVVVDMSGLNKRWLRRGRANSAMRQWAEKNGAQINLNCVPDTERVF